MDGLLGVAGMIITSDEMDHSRKFPAKHQQANVWFPPLLQLAWPHPLSWTVSTTISLACF